MQKGKLVIIEGQDGSGKTTQMELLIEYFKKIHQSYLTLKFPQYHKTFFGKWIGRFLKGEFGEVNSMSPYLLMFPFAADRWQAKNELEAAINEGKIVIADRYATSCAYQAAKVSRDKQEASIDLSYDIEYEAFGIPREDLVIYLDVPVAISHKMIGEKSPRKYLGNHQRHDLYESNVKLLNEVERIYLDNCEKYAHWVKIDCTENGRILSREKIHAKIIQVLVSNKIL